jgi:hypothetical protein
MCTIGIMAQHEEELLAREWTPFEEARKVIMNGTVEKYVYRALVQCLFPCVVDKYPSLLSVVSSPELVNADKTPLRMGARVRLEHLRSLYYIRLDTTTHDKEDDCVDCGVVELWRPHTESVVEEYCRRCGGPEPFGCVCCEVVSNFPL